VRLRVKYSLCDAHPSRHASRYMHDEARGCADLEHLDAQNREHIAAYTRSCRVMEALQRVQRNLQLLRKHQQASAS
jgi:hypothetical protein